ncbi:MAG: TadE/TadG family type IV pilus assembly protein [Thermoguttaceae bacterium]|jgi:Flp pilus assembly protein TadG
MRRRFYWRKGATAVEYAIVGPAILMLLAGMVVVGLGVFRYEQIAALAREGSRWASVHGGMYAQETGNSAATAADVYNNAILPMVAGLNTSDLSYTVTWNTSNYPYSTTIVNGQVVAVTNTVQVTVSYQWIPEAYLAGPFTLTSTSITPMSY